MDNTTNPGLGRDPTYGKYYVMQVPRRPNRNLYFQPDELGSLREAMEVKRSMVRAGIPAEDIMVFSAVSREDTYVLVDEGRGYYMCPDRRDPGLPVITGEPHAARRFLDVRKAMDLSEMLNPKGYDFRVRRYDPVAQAATDQAIV